MSKPRRTVLYVGISGDLHQRVYQHKYRLIEGFTRRYLCVDLVYFEETSDSQRSDHAREATRRLGRDRKAALIETMNPEWKDLSEDWY